MFQPLNLSVIDSHARYGVFIMIFGTLLGDFCLFGPQSWYMSEMSHLKKNLDSTHLYSSIEHKLFRGQIYLNMICRWGFAALNVKWQGYSPWNNDFTELAPKTIVHTYLYTKTFQGVVKDHLVRSVRAPVQTYVHKGSCFIMFINMFISNLYGIVCKEACISHTGGFFILLCTWDFDKALRIPDFFRHENQKIGSRGTGGWLWR